jgi:hypothetical protein
VRGGVVFSMLYVEEGARQGRWGGVKFYGSGSTS